MFVRASLAGFSFCYVYLCAAVFVNMLRDAPAAAAPAEVKVSTTPGLLAEKPKSGKYVETSQGFMIPYTQKIPGSDVEFEMVPIPGGEFMLGSPAEEIARNDDEGPQVRVKVPPFWLGKHEVTWAEYKTFMRLYTPFKQIEQLRSQVKQAEAQKNEVLNAALTASPLLAEQLDRTPTFVDGVTCPTPLYEPDATFESGDDLQLPAVTMTPYAARQYTKWLSSITGQSFRLPGEAEWEYAARSGSDAAYHFGNDPDEAGDAQQLAEYAWYAENSDDRARLVGQKQPNAWDLHDMLGNVGELVLDEYDAEAYSELAGDEPVAAEQTIRRPSRQYPRVVRGGSWLDEPAALRSAARMATDDIEWKMSDPNLPLSPWWFTELYPAGGVGFRVLRTLEPMNGEMRRLAWEIDADAIQIDVDGRLSEGRGALESVHPKLPGVLEQLNEPKVQGLLE